MSISVLIIEDEVALREKLVHLLTQAGFTPIVAADGREGIQKMQVMQPALVLCDIKLDGMSGYEVLQELRQDPETAHVAFIFLSETAEIASVRRAMNLGADDYLVKPIDSTDLIQAIQSRLKRQSPWTLTSQTLASTSPTGAATTARTSTARVSMTPPQAAPASVGTGVGTAAKSAAKSHVKPQRGQRIRRAYDPLTNLPNRASLINLLQETLNKAREYDYLVTVLSLNVVRFSSINAAFGFTVGDIVLHQLAERLHQQVGSHGTVIRTDGDEFTIILDNLTWEEDALSWADEIWRNCSAEFQVEGRNISLQIVIGGAFVQRGQSIPEQLVLQADMARRACEQWGGQVPYIFHDVHLAAHTVEQRLLETDLNRAIQQGEFQIYYQPQFTLPQGHITGVEALLRWRHPYRGMVSPDRFIAIAEEMGLIVPLGEWVLRTACLQVKHWQSLCAVPLKVSVNLSIRQLQQEHLASQITRILQAVDLHPCQLTLELTETNLMADVEQAVQTLTSLRALGIQIAIDDFGKGYSSLHYLSRLPIDILKIDQSFVRRLPDDSQATAISNAIINLAHDLSLTIVAEGVETERQVRFLTEHGCHIMQGHLYSPALPAEDFAALLQPKNCA